MNAGAPVAGLPMYDWPELRLATDAFWQRVATGLAVRGIAAAEGLARDLGEERLWRHPGLLLGQTCTVPQLAGRCGDALVVGWPAYDLPLARDGWFCSAIVVRRGEARGRGPQALWAMRGTRVAVNSWESYSGHIALRAHLAPLCNETDRPFFAAAVLSGAHRKSARMVARGEADLAALDGVVWALLASHERATAAALEIIALTQPAPALPFITAPCHAGHAGELRAALAEAARESEMPGLPRDVLAPNDSWEAPVRAAIALAARFELAPEAPDGAALSMLASGR